MEQVENENEKEKGTGLVVLMKFLLWFLVVPIALSALVRWVVGL